MVFDRSAGILLHPTSLPGPYGIGDIGPEAFRWLNFVSSTGCGLWQVLPLGPTGYGDSPYQCFSAFAGNPYLVSPETLLAEGLLQKEDLIQAPSFPSAKVDYGQVIPFKLEILDRSFKHFQENAPKKISQDFEEFKQSETHWLTDFAIFMAIKEAYGGGPWVDWPSALRQRNAKALNKFIQKNETAIERHTYRQFLFFRQWNRLRDYAHQLNIQIIGDIPIFVAHDSADVWAHPELFYLDEDGNPTIVAGVPPDYFSPTGQLWGNPLYNWDVHAKDGYQWWLSRLQAVLSMVDLVRLDHFRGFVANWEIDAQEETAMNGKWVSGPGKDFFQKVLEGLKSSQTDQSENSGNYGVPDEIPTTFSGLSAGVSHSLQTDLPIIAEDLGVITDDIVELRLAFNLPGMKIMVFAFDSDASNEFLPHNHTLDNVVYTGTHDNDTALGWYHRVNGKERDFARRYLARDGHDISWDLIRAAWGSVAVFALAPMQDFLGLDNHARMNHPSTLGGNWIWRMSGEALNDFLRARIAEMNQVYGRISTAKSKGAGN
jgi:4-alpha-glucanotransferase